MQIVYHCLYFSIRFLGQWVCRIFTLYIDKYVCVWVQNLQIYTFVKKIAYGASRGEASRNASKRVQMFVMATEACLIH